MLYLVGVRVEVRVRARVRAWVRARVRAWARARAWAGQRGSVVPLDELVGDNEAWLGVGAGAELGLGLGSVVGDDEAWLEVESKRVSE